MKKIILSILMILFIAPLSVYAQYSDGCYGMGMYPYVGFGAILMPIIWILFIGAIIYFVYRIAGGKSKIDIPHLKNSPMNILKERYAKGEINKDQFEEMKKELDK